MHRTVRPAKITPIGFIGPRGEEFLSAGGETHLGVDDGENAFFPHPGEKARGTHMDFGGSRRVRVS
jgi:hypothetical protein